MQPTSVEEMERIMNLMPELVIEMCSHSFSHNMLDFATCDSCWIHPLESHSEVSCLDFVMAWEISMVGNAEGKHSDFNNLENDELKDFDLLEDGFEVNKPLEVKCPNSLLGVGLHDNDVWKVKVNVDDQHITLLMDVVSLDMYEPEREYKLPLELGPHDDEVTMRENALTTQSNQLASFLFPPCVDYFVIEYEVGGIPTCLCRSQS